MIAIASGGSNQLLSVRLALPGLLSHREAARISRQLYAAGGECDDISSRLQTAAGGVPQPSTSSAIDLAPRNTYPASSVQLRLWPAATAEDTREEHIADKTL